MAGQTDFQAHHSPSNSAFRWTSLLACPACAGELASVPDELSCSDCSQRYPVQDRIARLFQPNDPAEMKGDVTELVRAFYEETPFPNYDDLDSRDRLILKAKRSIFARLLDEQLPSDAIVLEAGCGTGQLSNFLGMSWDRFVVGADLSVTCLRLAEEFRDRYSINNVRFIQMNLFRPPFRSGVFDLVVSNGVLHHTNAPKLGFESLIRTLKPGGHVIVGLYNKLGRLPTVWRRRLFEVFGEGISFLDPRLRKTALNEARRQAWFKDQYRHPHESRHSYDEVLDWFDAAGVDFVFSIPKISGSALSGEDRLFESHSRASWIQRTLTQIELLATGGAEGGFFIMIGRKR